MIVIFYTSTFAPAKDTDIPIEDLEIVIPIIINYSYDFIEFNGW